MNSRVFPLLLCLLAIITLSSSSSAGSLRGVTNDELYAHDSAQLPHTHNVIIQLHEWLWDDVAEECPYLREIGIGAVQISPPNEHLVIRDNDLDDDLPWYVRYQPVSFRLESRSGTEDQLRRMIQKCNSAGVRIVADAVINHVAHNSHSFKGAAAYDSEAEWRSVLPRSWAGSDFNAKYFEESFQQYNRSHFNDEKCRQTTNAPEGTMVEIQGDDYQYNGYRVQVCPLLGLTDVDVENPETQKIIADYLNRLIDYGVMGFRFDASKHMRTDGLAGLVRRLHTLNATAFGAKGLDALIYHEVIDIDGNEAVKSTEYRRLGRVKNFAGAYLINDAIRGFNNRKFTDILLLHERGWYGQFSDHEMITLVDNHDMQRDDHPHGKALMYKDGRMYSLAIGALLASTYGVPRIQASYAIDHDRKYRGPPQRAGADGRKETVRIHSNTHATIDAKTGECRPESGWICEHRWPSIRRMTAFRRDVGAAAMTQLRGDFGDNCFAFARLERGYFAANRHWADACYITNVDTTLPAGNYCNIWAQDYRSKRDICREENVIVVDDKGHGTFSVRTESIVAFTLKSRIGGGGVGGAPRLSRRATDRRPTNLSRLCDGNAEPATASVASRPRVCSPNATLIFMKRHVDEGQSVFLRGGNRRSASEIPIEHLTQLDNSDTEMPSLVYADYENWSQGDRLLDFFGVEDRQGTAEGRTAHGTPMIWTTDDTASAAYHEMNARYGVGADGWMVELRLDCNQSPTFELKGYIPSDDYNRECANNNCWEPNVSGGSETDCPTSVSADGNHIAECGRVNIFHWGQFGCKIRRY